MNSILLMPLIDHQVVFCVDFMVFWLAGAKLSLHIPELMIFYILMASLLQKATGNRWIIHVYFLLWGTFHVFLKADDG